MAEHDICNIPKNKHTDGNIHLPNSRWFLTTLLLVAGDMPNRMVFLFLQKLGSLPKPLMKHYSFLTSVPHSGVTGLTGLAVG